MAQGAQDPQAQLQQMQAAMMQQLQNMQAMQAQFAAQNQANGQQHPPQPQQTMRAGCNAQLQLVSPPMVHSASTTTPATEKSVSLAVPEPDAGIVQHSAERQAPARQQPLESFQDSDRERMFKDCKRKFSAPMIEKQVMLYEEDNAKVGIAKRKRGCDKGCIVLRAYIVIFTQARGSAASRKELHLFDDVCKFYEPGLARGRNAKKETIGEKDNTKQPKVYDAWSMYRARLKDEARGEVVEDCERTSRGDALTYSPPHKVSLS